MSNAFNPIQGCNKCKALQIDITFVRGASLKNDFIPIVTLDKTYPKDGFLYTESEKSFSLSPYIEERNYILETVKFDEKEEIVLRFSVNQGNSAANDGRKLSRMSWDNPRGVPMGNLQAVGHGVTILSQSEFKIKYDNKILLRLSSKDIKNGAYIDFIANDDDGDYSVANVHCGRVMITSQQRCYRKNDSGRAVLEINIRLAGFGGLLPTEEFTELTEKGVKQFQRDYMKMENPTGVADMETLRKIDEFSERYRENVDNYK
jgi:hypothetical protein